MADSQTEVVDNPGKGRFEIMVNGALAGFLEYHDRDGERVMPHTEISPDYQGQGLASVLIRNALDATAATDLQVLPRCPAVRGYIAKHPDYTALVPEDRRASFGLD